MGVRAKQTSVRKRRRDDLLDGAQWFIRPYIKRVGEDGGKVEASYCLNQRIWELIYG